MPWKIRIAFSSATPLFWQNCRSCLRPVIPWLLMPNNLMFLYLILMGNPATVWVCPKLCMFTSHNLGYFFNQFETHRVLLSKEFTFTIRFYNLKFCEGVHLCILKDIWVLMCVFWNTTWATCSTTYTAAFCSGTNVCFSIAFLIACAVRVIVVNKYKEWLVAVHLQMDLWDIYQLVYQH